MNPFAQYLQTHQIEPLRLSVLAGVRYVTVWNAVKGNPISQEHATKIRVALRSLTGIPYTGTILTIQEQPQRPTNTLPLRDWPKKGR